jgi:hypothetical protein
MNKDENQFKGVQYDQEKMQQVLNILNSIPVNGINQVNGMKFIFDTLTNPIPFNNIDENKDEQ